MEQIELIELTASQRAKKKYYEKIKNDPKFIEKRNKNCNKYYHAKLKNDQVYKDKVSVQKKEYYLNKKVEFLLEIIL